MRLLLSSPGGSAGEEQVVDFLRVSLLRGVNLEELWVADQAGRLVWAVLPVFSPGRTMMVFGGGRSDDPSAPEAGRELIEGLCDRHAGRVHLAEALIDPHLVELLDIYTACSFEVLAELVYLQASPPRGMPEPPLPPGLRWRTYSPQTHRLFAETILRSYEQSLDCPALNGRRAIEDVIAGHKACGRFDPKLWRLLCAGDAALGVLLLTRPYGQEGLELMYVGLAPEARGRGLSDPLMRQALCDASQSADRTLSLAVDASNAPALRVYFRHGMRRVCSKLALLRDLSAAGASVPQSIHMRQCHVKNR